MVSCYQHHARYESATLPLVSFSSLIGVIAAYGVVAIVAVMAPTAVAPAVR